MHTDYRCPYASTWDRCLLLLWPLPRHLCHCARRGRLSPLSRPLFPDVGDHRGEGGGQQTTFSRIPPPFSRTPCLTLAIFLRTKQNIQHLLRWTLAIMDDCRHECPTIFQRVTGHMLSRLSCGLWCGAVRRGAADCSMVHTPRRCTLHHTTPYEMKTNPKALSYLFIHHQGIISGNEGMFVASSGTSCHLHAAHADTVSVHKIHQGFPLSIFFSERPSAARIWPPPGHSNPATWS